MSILIYIILSLALLHFIYQGIILPSFRLKYRYKIFSMRDNLRRLKFERDNEIDDKLFEYLQTSLNITLNILYRIDFSLLVKAKSIYEHNEKFRNNIERRAKYIDGLFDKCDVTEIIEIRKKYLELLEQVLLANSGALLIYLVPIGLLALSWNWFTEFIKRLSAIEEKEVEIILPSGTVPVTP